MALSEICVLPTRRVREFLLVVDHPLQQCRVGGGQDLHRQQTSVRTAADGDRSYRYAARHLDDRKQRVKAAERGIGDWYADYRRLRITGYKQ